MSCSKAWSPSSTMSCTQSLMTSKTSVRRSCNRRLKRLKVRGAPDPGVKERIQVKVSIRKLQRRVKRETPKCTPKTPKPLWLRQHNEITKTPFSTQNTSSPNLSKYTKTAPSPPFYHLVGCRRSDGGRLAHRPKDGGRRPPSDRRQPTR